MAQDHELVMRMDQARKAAREGRADADRADASLDHDGPTHAQAIALTSIAKSLSAIATVLVATIDEDAR